MKRPGILEILVWLIALSTVASGAAQLICPRWVLSLVGGEVTPTSVHFFGIIGMFMLLFGGLVLHGLSAASTPAILWGAFQKIGASIAVWLGVRHGLFAPIALAIAGFDLFSSILYGWCWLRMANDPNT